MAEVIKRTEIAYIEGVNTVVAHNISKKEELRYAENVRSPQIGTIEKRKGQTAIGNDITATANYDLFYFPNNNALSTGLFRSSLAAGAASLYYLNTSDVWTALSGLGTGFLFLGDSTTQFDITGPTSTVMTYTYDTTGTNPYLSLKLKVGDSLYINAQNFAAANKGTFTVTEVGTTYFKVVNAAGTAENNKTIGTGTIVSLSRKTSHAIAEGCMFLVDGISTNRYINSDGTTVTDSTTMLDAHLYGSPKARKINYYKDKLYLGDFDLGAVRQRNSVQMSSQPLGILTLVSGDALAGAVTIEVPETKYFYIASDKIDVYRGGVKIETLTVTGKTEKTITVTATTNPILAADELWVQDTYDGTKKKCFRWASQASGTNIKQYDTFKFSGGDNDEMTIMTNIGNVMIMSNKNSMASWNGSVTKNFDVNVGCVSHRSFVKAYNMLFFVHYTGIYITQGEDPRLVSAKLDEYIRGATTAGLENSTAFRKGLSVFFCIGDVTLYNADGSIKTIEPKVCLEYDIKQENWYVHTNVNAKDSATYISSSDPDRSIFTHGSNFKVYEFLSGNSDDSAEIPMMISFPPITLSAQFENICFPQQILVEVETGNGIKCFVSLDEEPEYALKDEARKGVNIIKVTPPNDMVEAARCRKIRILFKEFSKAACKISRVALIYKLTEEQEIYHK